MVKKVPNLGMYVCSSETRVIFVSICGCHQNGWKEAEHGSHVKEIDAKTWILTRLHHFLTRYILGCTQRECKPSETIIER